MINKITKKLLTVVCAILVGCFNNAIANEVQTAGIELVDLSFEQAYQLMLENNNSLKAYNEAIAKTKFEKRAALGEFSPKVFLNSTYMHFSKDMQLHTPVITPFGSMTATSNIQDQNVFVMGGGVVWNVFTGGKLLSNHAAARAMYEASNAKYREVKDNLIVELVKRYYGLALAREVLATKKEYMDCVEQHLKDAKILEAEGIIAKAERLHAEVKYAEAKREYDSSLRDVYIVEEGLKALIKAESVDLKNVRIEPSTNLIMHDGFEVDVVAMKENALKNNPQLKQLQEKRKIMSAKYHAKNAEYLPTISLIATDIVAASQLSEAVPRGAFGATANWLLFDGLKREHNSVAAKHERKMVDYEIEDAKYNIEALVTKQYQELMKQKERFDSSKEALEKAEESLRVANLSFKEGFGTSLQVTDAQVMLMKTKTERLNSIYNFNVMLTELLKTNGDANEVLNYLSDMRGENEK